MPGATVQQGSEPLATPDRPWLGLAAFTEDCREYFYGRDAERRDLADRVSRVPLTILFGISGYGKTSLLGAGLIPDLRKAGHRVVFLHRCYDDLSDHSLSTDVFKEFASAGPGTAPAINGEPCTLWEFFHDLRQPWFRADANETDTAPARPVLILDQFEEIFIKGEDRTTKDGASDERARKAARAFLTELADLVENRPPAAFCERLDSLSGERKREIISSYDFHAQPVCVVIALREDYVTRLERWRERMPAVMEHRIELRLLSGRQAFNAVFEPGTKRAGRPPIFSREVAESIVRAAAGAAADAQMEKIDAVPPILSLLCERLNARRLAVVPPPDSISMADFAPDESLRILSDFYKEKTGDHHRTLRDFIEDELVSDSGLRETVTLDSARADLRGVPDYEQSLRSLVDARILIIEDRNGIARVELTHDTLARCAHNLRRERRAQEEERRLHEEMRHAEDEERRVQDGKRREWEHHRRKRALVQAWISVVVVVCFLGWALWEREQATKQAAIAVQEKINAQEQQREAMKAKQVAEDQSKKRQDQVRESSRLDFATAQARLADGKWPAALADGVWQMAVVHLARAIRNDPKNQNAQNSLWLALSFGARDAGRLPVREFLHASSVITASYSADGTRILTVNDDRAARIWDVESGKLIGALLRHAETINSATFSADGIRVLTASDDHTARVWDAMTGTPIGNTLTHAGPVTSAGFSADGAYVITASEDRTARIWDARTGTPIGNLLRHEDGVTSAAFSEDGTRVITASRDNTARIWDAKTGIPVGPPIRHQGTVVSAAFSPDGTRVITASRDKTARIWDAKTGKQIGDALQHEDTVTIAIFSPDGTRILTASEDPNARKSKARANYDDEPEGRPHSAGHDHDVRTNRIVESNARPRDSTARIWDAKTGKSIGYPLKHEEVITSTAFSPDGTRVLTASRDKTACMWDTDSGMQIGPAFQHEGFVTSAAFSPDGIHVVTSSQDKTARIWDVAIPMQACPPLKHRDNVRSATFSPDGTRILTACDDHTARIWNVGSGMQIGPALWHDGIVRSAAFGPDGMRIVTASEDGTARIWDAKTGNPICSPLKHGGIVTSATFNPAGTRVLTAGSDHTGRMWNAKTGEPMGSPLTHEKAINSATFSPDGTRVITASDDHTARIWDARTGLPIGSPLAHEGEVTSAAFSRDSTLVVTASVDKTARIWDANTGTPTDVRFTHENEVHSTTFDRDGKRVLTAGNDYIARIWDVKSGEQVIRALDHSNLIYSATFSPDGTRVLTAGMDGNARLWDALSGLPLGVSFRHGNTVNTATFSPDGTRILTTSMDKTVRIWDAKSEQSLPADIAEDIAALCCGAKLDPELGSLLQLTAEERKQIWGRLQSKLDLPPEWRFTAEQTFPQNPLIALISPRMTLTVREASTRRLESFVKERILEASASDPTNPVLPFAHAAIAAEETEKHPANPVRAAWLCEYGMKHLPAMATRSDLRLAARYLEIVANTVPSQKANAALLQERAK